MTDDGWDNAVPVNTPDAAATSSQDDGWGNSVPVGTSPTSSVSPPQMSTGEALVRGITQAIPFEPDIVAAGNTLSSYLPQPVRGFLGGPQQDQSGESFGQRYQENLTTENAQNQQALQQHPVADVGGQIAGGVAALPVAGMEEIGSAAASRIAPFLPALGTRAAGAAATGAGLGALYGAGTGNTTQEMASNALSGAEVGGIGGGLVSAVPSAVKGILGAIPGKVSPQTANLANTAINQFGIGVTAPQMSMSPAVKFINSAIEKLPFSGAGGQAAELQSQFNRAVSSTFGENVPAITPEVMANARDRIGNVFNDVAQKTPQIAIDPRFGGDILGILNDAKQVMTDNELAPINNQIKNIISKVDPNTYTMTGDQYQALTRKGTPLSLTTQSQNPNIRFFAGQIRDALDGALERSTSPDTLSELSQARSQWRNMRTVEPLVAKSGEGGISPVALKGRVVTQNKGTYGAAYGGGGDLNLLADIGQRFLKSPPSSGTAERGAALAGLAGAGEIAGGLITGEPISSLAVPIAGTAATLGAGRATGAFLRSKWLANAVINRSLGRPMTPGMTEAGSNTALAAGVTQIPSWLPVPQNSSQGLNQQNGFAKGGQVLKKPMKIVKHSYRAA